MLHIQSVKFRPVWAASGVQGFFGEGYWFHRWLHLIGMWLVGLTFVAKTTTLNPRKGNMPQKEDGITPQEKFPRCVVVKFFKRVVLNAVGLSGPGIKALLEKNLWQQRTEPFMVSFMSVAPTQEERLHEFRQFVDILDDYIDDFETHIGLQINGSYPNVGAHFDNFVREMREMLDIGAKLHVPLFLKITLTLSPQQVREIATHPALAGIVVSNTIPYGELPEHINWKKLFGSDISPLIKRGFEQKGGLFLRSSLHTFYSGNPGGVWDEALHNKCGF